MRKQLLSVFLPLLILVMIAAAAETPSTGTETTKSSALQRVNVVRGVDGISVEITSDAGKKYRVRSRSGYRPGTAL